MKKKSIGKFISALRRANGMTQKDLGERLFVSDKTVSRWECDECTPDLSLIPLIAETFGITTDELLRGEKNNTEKVYADPEAAAFRQKEKSDKQLKLMLDEKLRKFKNLKLVAMGISLFGLFAGILCLLIWSAILIGLIVATVFIVAGEICMICFVNNTRIFIDEEDDEAYNIKIREINSFATKSLINVSFWNVVFWIIQLTSVLSPNAPNLLTLLAEAVLLISIVYTLYHSIYFAFLKNKLVSKGKLLEKDVMKSHTEKPSKILFLGLGVTSITGIIIVLIRELLPLIPNEGTENEINLYKIGEIILLVVIIGMLVATITYFVISLIKESKRNSAINNGNTTIPVPTNYSEKFYKIFFFGTVTSMVILMSRAILSIILPYSDNQGKPGEIVSIVVAALTLCTVITTVVLIIMESVKIHKKNRY